MNKAEGYAVVDSSGILVRTTGPTARSAMVNWLCVKGILITNKTSDSVIWDVFMRAAPAHNAEVKRVQIEIVEDA
jgi:hypothetical protein